MAQSLQKQNPGNCSWLIYLILPLLLLTISAQAKNDSGISTQQATLSFMQAVENGDAEPVMVNGQAWTFRTPPPPANERTVRTDHPRLLLTADNLPDIITKLQDPVYSSYMVSITTRADSGKMLENAFLYQLTGDLSRAQAAKQALLDFTGSYGEQIIFGYDQMSDRFGPVLVFDWIMDTLTELEKTQIFANVKDNFAYDHQAANPVHTDGKGPGTYPWYWNDVYNRHPEIFLPALAFAIAGDGIDDAWAQEVIDWAYDEEETRVVGPYGPNRGSGFLDVLMTMSLDTGGFSDAATQYYTYWMEAFHAVSFWETATGEPMWSRSPWLEKGAQSLLTSREGIRPSARILSVIEFVTGMYSGDTAALAKYVVNYKGTSNYHHVHRAILGDMRVVEKTPAEVNIPTAKYERGDQVFYSKSSWESDAVSLYVRAPYINVGRGVGSTGVFGIDLGEQPIAPRVLVSKTPENAGYSSGLWIYDPIRTDDNGNLKIVSVQNSGTYWGWNSGRSFDAWTTVNQAGYFEGSPASIAINNNYRAINMDYGWRFEEIAVTDAQRTIVHIPDGSRNYIVIYDYIDVPSDIKSAWQMRLLQQPGISTGQFSIPGLMHATVVAPQNHTIEWLGGENLEFVTPSPERQWYTRQGDGTIPGYSITRPSDIDRLGLGNIYIQPQGQINDSTPPYVQQTEYLVVLEISSLTPVSVTRISDREVSFGGWQIAFNQDGSYVVNNLGSVFVDGFE